jgi:hypothetical protein
VADYTQDAFAQDVLVKLGIQDPTEPATGQSLNFVKDRLSQTLEELQDDQLVDWVISGDIPGARYNALLMVMEGVLSDAYGVAMPLDPLTGRALSEERGRQALRNLVRGEYITPPWDRARDY